MSLYTISNDRITLQVESKGAEIKSLNSGDREYMWHGDPKYWGRTSPVLFPIVGSLKDKTYTLNGKKYSMGQHGFARDNEFEVIESNIDSITLKLTSNDTIKEIFPLDFELVISYRLSENSVIVGWTVNAPEKLSLDFSIGGHPAFLCETEGYSLHLYKNGEAASSITYQKLSSQGTLIRNTYTEDTPEGVLPITQERFMEDALILDNSGINQVGIADASGDEYLTVEFDSPLLGLWTPAGKNAPFICIEPWYGRCDAEDFAGSWGDREHIIHLEAGENWSWSYKINV